MSPHAVAVLAGGALGLLSFEPWRRRSDRVATIGAGVGLVTAAVIYPAARREHPATKELALEGAVVAGTLAAAVAAVTAGRSPVAGRRLLALAWASHAVFDLVQGPSADSRLPAWYAPLCAGYDVALAGQLLRR